MKVVALQEIGIEVWNSFCNSSEDAWLRHTTDFLALSRTLDVNTQDCSFAVTDGEKLVAVVPLLVQGEFGTREFRLGGTPVPFPALHAELSEEEKNQALSFVFEEIARIARSMQVVKATFFLDPIAESSAVRVANPLVPFEFADTSITTTCVDLTHDDKTLLSAMAKGHRTDIQYALKKTDYHISFFDHTTCTPELEKRYMDIYFAAAGRVVGSSGRWEKTFDLVRAGSAFVVFGSPSQRSEFVSCAMVFTYKRAAYYAQSALLPEARTTYRGLGHLMQWEIMQKLKREGCIQYEIGWQEKPEDISEKEQAIARFKRLFGGAMLPMFRGVRTY
jgi:hypothetical protein